MSPQRRSRDILWLVPVLVIYFGFLLGGRALWSPVEGRYAEVAREMVVSGDYVTPRLNGVKYFEKPPLFYWLEAFSIKLAGVSESALRFWPALFALLGCIVIYAAGRELFDARAGLLAAIVLATTTRVRAASEKGTEKVGSLAAQRLPRRDASRQFGR